MSALLGYWDECPPAHEILAAVHIGPRRKPGKAKLTTIDEVRAAMQTMN